MYGTEFGRDGFPERVTYELRSGFEFEGRVLE